MFALGTSVRLSALRTAGVRAALLGLGATLLVAALAYAGAVLVT